MRCDTCKHNRSGTEDIIVDGRTAAQYEEWGCTKEDDLTEEQQNAVYDGGDCPLYEYDENIDDPCYGCPGSPDYCENCNGRDVPIEPDKDVNAHLTCKTCGYKQYDINTVVEYRKAYPGMPDHDIPYECRACCDQRWREIDADAMDLLGETFTVKVGENDVPFEFTDGEHEWWVRDGHRLTKGTEDADPCVFICCDGETVCFAPEWSTADVNNMPVGSLNSSTKDEILDNIQRRIDEMGLSYECTEGTYEVTFTVHAANEYDAVERLCARVGEVDTDIEDELTIKRKD